MNSSKRTHAGIERELARALTWACESAKSGIVGFDWLTHRVDYQRFPDSLVVTWVFDTEKNRSAAISGPDCSRMHDFTLAAFEDVGITVADITRHVESDSEERCKAAHGGDWDLRLSSRQRSGGRHGKGH
ncbi:hypothetical protein EGJ27_00725 [Pseudomonas sp. v388]|uniref:hypothetical protein n=1 Tax=Pseudomonas sp. v388 TaxID=2479849 RepID=UPI000F77AEFE|nr:hypothetical protein [Pseudomonas sp. v388]RRV10189.1 hypothetical protein EGJ27_00725 [Pseudomonas sp. v388]